MKDRRKFIRFPVRLGARYAEENKEDREQQCSIVNISREGMGVTAYLKTKFPLGHTLKFEVDVPAREKTISFIGSLSWIKALKEDPDYNFKGGIELIIIDSEDKWALLDYAYETWKEGQEAEDDTKETST